MSENVFEQVEVDRIDDPNDNLRAQAKADGQCACRLWLIVFLANISVIIILIFLILLLLVEIGPVRKCIPISIFVFDLL